MTNPASPSKPYETALTILIACTAALAGVAGYLSAQHANTGNDATAQGLTALNDANTLRLEAEQTLLHDDQVIIQVIILESENRTALARELLEGTELVRRGYVDADFNVAPPYTNISAAFEAYETEMFNASQEARVKADDAFKRSEVASGKSLEFLLATVVLAIAAVLATVAMTADGRTARGSLALMALVSTLGTAAFILVTALS